MVPLSAEQAEIARIRILENALSLIEEAQLLYNNKFFARSYTLAHIASEEIVKIPMIVRAVLDDMAGISFDWQKLEKRLRSHPQKIDAAHLHDYMQTEIRADNSDVRAYEAALEDTQSINATKNSSLYSGFFEGVATSPLEQISEDMARAMIDISRQRVQWIKRSLRGTY